MIPPLYDAFPPELSALPQWVGWKLETRDGKPTKPPYQLLNEKLADTTDAATWADFNTVLRCGRKFDGVGFVFTKESRIIGVDLDSCCNAETGETSPWAARIIKQLNSRTERSPSLTGWKVFISGTKTFPNLNRKLKFPPMSPDKQTAIEVYDSKKYFTVTGDLHPGVSPNIEERSEELEAIYQELFPPKTAEPRRAEHFAPTPLAMTDDQLIEKIRRSGQGVKFDCLWRGDITDYGGDESRADSALCCILAAWTGKDARRIESLFGQSGLNREKWEARQDYRDRTIKYAIENTTWVYEERPEPSANSTRSTRKQSAEHPAPETNDDTEEHEAGEQPETDPAPEEAEESGRKGLPYKANAYGIVRFKHTPDGPAEIPLTNFTAKIVATTTIDDGAETSLSFDIEAYRNGRRYAFDVPAKEFSALEWPILKMGPETIVYPGQSAKDHTRCAIQVLSGSPEERFQFRHTGWRKIGPSWVYLHGDGWIGGELPGHVSVVLDGGLAGYRLPPPAERAFAREAVRASLRLLDLGPATIILPVYAALWRSVVDACDFAVHLAGATQSGKSTLAALLQQHLGAGMNARSLPGAWSSTDNALEGMGFAAKDAPLVIDDFVPRGGVAETQRLYAKAERVLRAQGNNSGRLRMRPDGTLRPAKPPRGMILSTGEDIPKGESLLARMLILEMARGDLKIEALNTAQADADSGVYAQAMAAFLAWLAPQYVARRQEMREAAMRQRDQWGRGELMRTPDLLANLAAGFQLFLCFCVEFGVLTEKNAQALGRKVMESLLAAGEAQARHQGAAEPARRFVELLQQALESGKAYLTNERDGRPDDPGVCGWRMDQDSRGDYLWEPLGDRIGWITGDGVYLLPEAAYNVAKRMGDAGGEGISIAPRTLAKRLRERGLLATVDTTRNTSTVRKTFGGETRGVREVLHFSVGSLIVTGTDKTD